jgi:predicted acetylornithine/succinylornithine family transaminase
MHPCRDESREGQRDHGGSIVKDQLKEREQRFVMQTYRRAEVEFVRGEGALLFDDAGREYVDLLSGISVASLGHCAPAVTEAVTAQAGQLLHVSNLFYTEPMVDLAELLSQRSIGGPVFFCNSGTEANECAIKVARKHAHGRGIENPEIIVFEGDFHGRSYGALSATPGLAASPALGPMMPGFTTVPFDDPDALAQAFSAGTAAVFMEPIQGEAGVFPVPGETLEAARRLCDESGALLMLDEVQTGVGRTGSLWAYEQTSVRPDVLTTAKALGGGVAIGACVNSATLGQVLEPGDHGSTFAAGPVATSAAMAVLEAVDNPDLLRRVRDLGGSLMNDLGALDGVATVRGRGLMIGVALEDGLDSRVLNAGLLDRGFVANAPRPDTLRLLPPFVLTDEQAGLAVTAIGGVLSGMKGEAGRQ